jgi:hypothetical protein
MDYTQAETAHMIEKGNIIKARMKTISIYTMSSTAEYLRVP